jgi:hypothetical protein
MKLWVRFVNGEIIEGPIGSDEQPDGYIEYIEIDNRPTNHGITTVTIQQIDGRCVKQLAAEQDYRIQRVVNYPGLSDQMDMLWHAMDRGEFPKVEPFYTQIAEVKARFPKS